VVIRATEIPAENFGGDPYHVGWSHYRRCSVYPGGATGRAGGRLISQGSMHHRTRPGNLPTDDPTHGLQETIRPEVEQRLGPRGSLPIVGTLFPNFPFLRASARTFRVWHRWAGQIECGLHLRRQGPPQK